MAINYDITWAGIFRVFRVADKLVREGGYLSEFDKSTYMHLFSQLDETQKEHIIDKFGDTFDFLFQ